MGNMLVSCAVDRGFEPRSCQAKDYEVTFSCSSTKHAIFRRKGKSDGLGIRIMCPSVTICLHGNCCFSVTAL